MSLYSGTELTKDKFLNEEEVEHLEALIERNDCRDSILIALGLYTGGRAQEILNIRKKDLNVYDRSVLIHGLKNSRNREIPLSKKIFSRLLKQAENKGDEDLIFDISYERLNQIWQVYRPASKKTFHSLRHTFALNLYKRCKDIRLVQTAMGHKSINSTMIYQTYHHTVSELRRAMF